MFLGFQAIEGRKKKCRHTEFSARRVKVRASPRLDMQSLFQFSCPASHSQPSKRRDPNRKAGEKA